MTIDKLNEQARIVSEQSPPEVRAPWLHWNATLMSILSNLQVTQQQQTASISSLRNELTVIIHAAIREYAAGDETSRAAILEEIAVLKAASALAASDRRVMLTLLGAIATHLGMELDPHSVAVGQDGE